ncbi:hypothetical protein DPMN_185841 [Dreissena polymorpha]|uniref:Uncharacterized protein n=1 Tax=Dreissena polymorpha TaxID=45954 RepID=A0A9D4DLN3_DREPO|nr:hypothetical protein DPMN_185841 [Dreissena polymorpha]
MIVNAGYTVSSAHHYCHRGLYRYQHKPFSSSQVIRSEAHSIFVIAAARTCVIEPAVYKNTKSMNDKSAGAPLWSQECN